MPRARRKVRRRKNSSPREGLELKSSTRSAITGTLEICMGVLLFLALRDQAGAVGASVRRILTFFFGAWGMLFPSFLILTGMLQWILPERRFSTKRTTGLFLCLIAFLGLVHIRAPLEEIGTKRDELAGAIGFLMSLPFLAFFSGAVGYTVLGTIFLVGLFIAFEPDVGGMLKAMRQRLERPREVRRAPIVDDVDEDDEATRDMRDEDDEDLVEQDAPVPELNIVRPVFAQSIVTAKSEKAIRDATKPKKHVLEMKDTRYEEWTFPAFDLLEDAQSHLQIDDEELKRQARLIEEKLQEFGIDVTMRDARPGPTVTQFTLQPAEGVKLSKIGSLKDDLSLALAAQSLRIEAPIPGKSLVGIEMPNSKRTTVHLKEILESPSFVQSESGLTLPLGRDVSGDAIVANLETMPHLLIAGATGSGKSVCMNTFLIALLFQNAPHELKFILIDPKRVELLPYDGIPHLLTPVITEAEKALQALRWAVAEMGRRLHRFSEQGARNIDEFNAKQTNDEDMLPRIVIVIDELADLMMRQYRKDTETMIARISQIARATGMHLIIATQRPSVDVITGLIKANIPTRIAFRVVSSVDSRTIIDGIGAEDLLGQGDMLYMTASIPKPLRIQGIFTSTKEVERVINAVKIAGGGKITEQIGLGGDEEDDEEEEDGAIAGVIGPQHIDLEADDNGGDDLFFEAVQVVQHSGKASASLLQRQLKVGYARAARLLDIMEEKGLIGPVDGAKPRKVYMERTVA
ncbi:DNA translocase FtsK 4TM domain-containing protein [Candidatus Peregrinibacteria bacterium]|nr:DNA translocase FtsK 4TM domain-containing protein [Candidatus Peregrinibacteria bacterium]